MARGRGNLGLGKRGSGKLAGGMNSKFLTNLNRQNGITPRGGSQFLSNLGNMVGANRDPGKYGQADLGYQEGIREDIFKKTIPDVNFVGGTTRYR